MAWNQIGLNTADLVATVQRTLRSGRLRPSGSLGPLSRTQSELSAARTRKIGSVEFTNVPSVQGTSTPGTLDWDDT